MMESLETHSEAPERSVDDHLRVRPLPLDLPRSLDDRQPLPSFGQETEMYDAWQGMATATLISVDLYMMDES